MPGGAAEAMFTRRFDRRVRTFGAVFSFSLVLGLSFGTYALWPANQERGFQPEQPVYFPHSVMAGKHEIDCLYCHTEAEKGPNAGIPPVSRELVRRTLKKTTSSPGWCNDG